MDKNIHIQLNEITRLMNYDRSKTLLEQGSADIMVDRMSMKKAGVGYEDYKKANELNIDELASMICGEKSMFAGGKVPVLDYPTEELTCDVIAGALMAFGPIGVAAGLFVEFLHAKDLWNKGDKVGAAISMTIGLLPVIGDSASILLRSMLRKGGKTVWSKALKTFVNYIRFLQGELGASKIWNAIRTLSPNERSLFFELSSVASTVFKKSERLIPVMENIKNIVDNLPFIGDDISIAINNIIILLEGGGFKTAAGDFLAQSTGLMFNIFAAEFGFESAKQMFTKDGFDPECQTKECYEEQFNKYSDEELILIY